jgi:hypothetical protein
MVLAKPGFYKPRSKRLISYGLNRFRLYVVYHFLRLLSGKQEPLFNGILPARIQKSFPHTVRNSPKNSLPQGSQARPPKAAYLDIPR